MFLGMFVNLPNTVSVCGWFSDTPHSWWYPRVRKYSILEAFGEACIFVSLKNIFIQFYITYTCK